MSDENSVRDYHDTEGVIGEVECTLNEAEAAERGNWVEEKFVPVVEGVEERENGYLFTLPNSKESLQAAVSVVLLESRCCSDQGYRLEVPADGSEIRLAISGPSGTKDLLREGLPNLIDNNSGDNQTKI